MKQGIALVLMLFPASSYAGTVALGPIGTTLDNIARVIDTIIPLLLSIAVLLFFWGLVKYITNASDEAAKEQGKTLMIWGMIAIFVMVAFWGIIGYVQDSLGLNAPIQASTGPRVNIHPD